MSRRVLHIVESLSSGVATAIEAYVENRPAGTTHTVYGYRRPGVQVGDGLADHATVVELPPDRRGQLGMIRKAVRSDDADVVHVHSSWAGLAVRCLPRPGDTRLVYTPHCFAFERLDLSRAQRRAIGGVESGLLRRTDVVAAVGHHEAKLARQMDPTLEVVEVPQALPARLQGELIARRRDPAARTAEGKGSGSSTRVCAVGRLSPQKGVAFFLEVVQVAHELAAARGIEPFEFTWVGGEDPNVAGGAAGFTRQLSAAGVRVTGWVDRSIAMAELAGSDVYLHTAAWGGFPLTVLEAAELEVPVVARTIDSLTEMPLPTMATTPEGLAHILVGLRDRDTNAEALAAIQLLRQMHAPELQRKALAQVYRVRPEPPGPDSGPRE